MTEPLPPLDAVLHQPARTQIAAVLSGRGETSFSDLKRTLGATDGNLGAHLGKLVDAGLIEPREGSAEGRALTLFRLTRRGRSALERYLGQLSELIELSGVAPRGPLRRARVAGAVRATRARS